MYFYVFSKDGGSHITYNIDPNINKGTKYSLKVVVSGGVLKIYYNGALNQTVNITSTASDRSDVHFKTGDYCQSDLSEDSHTDYCEVY